MTLAERAREDSEIGRTVELLGGRRTVHRAVETPLDAHDLLREGLPGHALEHLMRRVPLLRLHQGGLEKVVGISLRTYQRKKDDLDKLLSPEQSGRTWKFAALLARASEIFGSQADAERWMEQPAIGLDQRRPIDLLSTPTGVAMLEDHLTRLEYGVYA